MKKYIVILLSAFVFTACSEDWLNLEPSTSLTPTSAFQTLDDAQIALNGVYNALYSATSGSTYYGADIFSFGDVKGDDVRTFEPGKRTAQMYRYTETPESSTSGFWRMPYRGLMNANAIIAEIDNLEVVTEEEEAQKENILGQAMALRALFHFDLVRIYGKMPENGNPTEDLGVALADRIISPAENLPRNTVEVIYNQVIQDLTDAIPMLTTDKVTDGTINNWAAKALLSRVYLYNKQYGEAYTLAADIIDNGPYSLLSYADYTNSWATGFSTESIFEIVFNAQTNSDREGIGYLWEPGGYGAMTLTDDFIAMMQADPDDIRNSIILEDSRTPGRFGYLAKYPGKDGESSRINNPKVVRLAEVYLIAAEAGLQSGQGDPDALIKELYDARTDRDNTVSGVDLDRILLERRKELIGEGHRFFDLMRNGLPVVRSGSDHFSLTLELQPTDYRAIQPIPQYEMNANPEMEQNAEYGL